MSLTLLFIHFITKFLLYPLIKGNKWRRKIKKEGIDVSDRILSSYGKSGQPHLFSSVRRSSRKIYVC